MTDLTFCYIHMSRNELFTIDTHDTPDYITGDLEGNELEIPDYMMPPNPDDSESTHVSVLPSQVHPSYPYGNPTSMKHPVNKARTGFDPASRALFEDMGFAGGGVNGQFRWNELALDQLLPIDEEKEEAKRAAQARKMASGASGQGAHPNQQQPQQPQQQQQPVLEADVTADENDGEEEEEDEEEDEEDEGEEDEEEDGEEEDLDEDEDEERDLDDEISDED